MNKKTQNYLSAITIAVLTLSFVVTYTYAEENKTGENFRPKPPFPQWSLEMKENREELRERREAFHNELQEKRDAWKEEVAAKREEFRNANREIKEKFWSGAKRMLGERFAMAVANMERAQTRVEGAIDEAEEDGKNTTEAQELLNNSKEKLGDATDKIAEIKALVPSDGEAVTPELFEAIKLKAREAKDLLKESHKALMDAVAILKAL